MHRIFTDVCNFIISDAFCRLDVDIAFLFLECFDKNGSLDFANKVGQVLLPGFSFLRKGTARIRYSLIYNVRCFI